MKPFFFAIPPERAHHFTLSLFKFALRIPLMKLLLKKRYTVKHEKLEKNIFGLTFPNPVGLAAGFDKNGEHIDSMSTLGFGFIEIGTVTPKPQAGNPQPRLFRLPKDEALINRMGFNNDGIEAVMQALKKYQKDRDFIIGGNIGKNKITPNEEAVNDYAICFEQLFPYVDYFVVNVSSPNTPGLRSLQEKGPLTAILTHLQKLNQQKGAPRPILLKIAPDLNNDQLDDIIDIVKITQIDGIIATNTTISRQGLHTPTAAVENIGNGGLSGRPLKERATEVIRYIHQKSEGHIPIIGVGGIASAEDALEKLEAGAQLVQIYSGMVYEGPSLVKQINKAILKK